MGRDAPQFFQFLVIFYFLDAKPCPFPKDIYFVRNYYDSSSQFVTCDLLDNKKVKKNNDFLPGKKKESRFFMWAATKPSICLFGGAKKIREKETFVFPVCETKSIP